MLRLYWPHKMNRKCSTFLSLVKFIKVCYSFFFKNLELTTVSEDICFWVFFLGRFLNMSHGLFAVLIRYNLPLGWPCAFIDSMLCSPRVCSTGSSWILFIFFPPILCFSTQIFQVPALCQYSENFKKLAVFEATYV